MMEGFDECRKRLLEMGYPESDVDEVLARMRREEEEQIAAQAARGDLTRDQVAGAPEKNRV
jgi:hypothetical protein